MNEPKNPQDLHQIFISNLELHYGRFSEKINKFESTSNSKIARDLCYSDSQFSRLINNTASKGEFERGIRNVQRLLNSDKMQEDISKSSRVEPKSGKGLSSLASYVIITLLFLLLIFAVKFLFFNSASEKEEITENISRYDMLKWSFENKYINPYVKLKQLPKDCNYPCYKYQGKWKLKQEYKIPFFRERNGFHYIAKEAVMYARCMDERNEHGVSFEGYEYQKHEIWYDKREFPIDSFLVKGTPSQIRPKYNNSNLEEDSNFVKIAFIHTFFRSEIGLDSLKMNRTGKAMGRDIEFVDDDILLKNLDSQKLIDELESEINAITKNRIEDFSKPVTCEPSPVPNKNFHLIDEGDELSFNCQFSTGRFLVNYNKIYVLDDQYINNQCR